MEQRMSKQKDEFAFASFLLAVQRNPLILFSTSLNNFEKSELRALFLYARRGGKKETIPKSNFVQ